MKILLSSAAPPRLSQTPRADAAHATDDRLSSILGDIRERKKLQLALQQQLDFANSLNRISRTVLEHEDAELLLGNTLHIVGETLGADRALIYDICFERHEAIGLSQWLNPLYPEITPTKGTYPLDVFIDGTAEIRRSRTFLVSHSDRINPNLQGDGSGQILHEKMKIRSLLWYPFAFRNDGYYLLVLNQTQSRKDWSGEELAYLHSVSQLLSVALEKIRLVEQRETALADLRVAATAFEALEGVLITDASETITRVNRAFTRITGYAPEEVVGKTPRMFKSGRQNAEFYQAMWERIHAEGAWHGEIWNRRRNGEAYPEYLTINAVKGRDGQVTNYVATFSDISQRKSAEEEIKSLAFFDPLTQLPNRRHLLDRLKQALAAGARGNRQGALLFIDLDNFKSLNDTLGHDKGDLLLQEVGHRLASTVGEADTVARLGGDEFVVLLADLSEHTAEAVAQAGAAANRIMAALNRPYQLAGVESHSTQSVGITLLSRDNSAVSELLKQADIAMYQSKRAGRNTIRFFDPTMQELLNSRAALEKELRKAIENEEFRLHYQIQVDSLGRPFGAEALIRWQHPVRGLVAPAQFIALAEETGLILPIGQWVLQTACSQIRAWDHDDRTSGLVLCVNVSATQFRQRDFVDQVAAVVRDYGINPGRLKLELTESTLLVDIEEAIVSMNALKQVGVRFTLDDFGTGYSSLQYLKRLRLGQLKIDRSFVQDIAVDSSDRAIVSTIVAMARTLQMAVIAEGIETAEQRQCLLRAGCTHFQGFLFGKPVPIEQFESRLKDY